MRLFLCIIFVLCLASCVHGPTPEQMASADYGSYPESYKEVIQQYFSKSLFDPYSAQYSDWRGPSSGYLAKPFGGETIFGYRACVEVNAKNRMGGYTGSKQYFFMIRNGGVAYVDGGYSMSVEKVKAAFRISYSLFDKMAYFINAYWNLGMPERSTNFRTIWYAESKKGQQRSLRDSFSGYENLPLRGLYWVSKDLLGTDADLADTMEPDAEALSTIRNHLEHKYLKIHDPPWTLESFSDPIHDPFRDSMAYSVSRDDFEAKCLRLLKLARAGLIYLSLAVFQEERLRAKCRDNSLVMPMALSTWPDHLKR